MRILHTMLRVGDLERSLAFYRDVLGMQLISRKDYPDGKFTLAFIGYGKNPEQAEIELTYNWGVASYEIGTAYGHIALGVDDLTATLERLEALDIRPERPPDRGREGGSLLCVIRDPDNYRIDLIERPGA